MSKYDNHYLGALMEDINDRLKKVQESLLDLPAIRKDIGRIKADQAEMKQWRSIADSVFRDH
ncbi:MAG TPA: hypothetical protein VIJ68_03565, partial [Candidatus Saccharimonadales bacterium]